MKTFKIPFLLAGLAAFMIFSFACVTLAPESPTPKITPTKKITPTLIVTRQFQSFNILWIESCDPRTDPDFCHSSKNPKPLYPRELDQFYGVITAVNATISYSMPSSENDLSPYDVVIVDFCGPAGNDAVIKILKNYVSSGGSIIVMGDEFCQGVGPINGDFVSSAKAATFLTKGWGIVFTGEDDSKIQTGHPVDTNPLVKDVSELYAYRHGYLDIESPSKVLIEMDGRPFIAIYNQTGTVIAIPDVGFHWGQSFQEETVDSDNFVFWRNMLNWLADQSRMKR